MPLETLVLQDDLATAKILPGLGFNCFSYQLRHAGRPIELLWADPDFAAGNGRPSASGIPILFPFPGRIRGTTLHYEGHDYPLEPGDGAGNAIHGFVLDRPWRVVESTATGATGQFQAAVDDPALLRRWPSDFCITVRYELRGGRLMSELRIDNPADRPLPFGLGTHAYFRLPLVPGAVAEDCVVTVPAAQVWELVDLLATGRIRDAHGPVDLRTGKRFGDCHLDDALTGLQYQGGRCRTSIRDPASGACLTQIFDDSLRHCVVYTPPHREAICMEPYTCVPDPFRLAAEGIDTGLRRLEPGQSYRTTIEIGLAAL